MKISRIVALILGTVGILILFASVTSYSTTAHAQQRQMDELSDYLGY